MNPERYFKSSSLQQIILGGFVKVPVSKVEKNLARSSVKTKYVPSIRRALVSAFLIFPAILFHDTTILINVLIPVTMVSGTAWYSVSLASVKKKFEVFGMELTKHLFSSFSISLIILFMVTTASLTKVFWAEPIQQASNLQLWQGVSAILGILAVGDLLFQIFVGSLKYDINDTMLTGQNEAAEKFYRNALSLLHSTAESLSQNNSIHVANYLIGVCFYEVFSQVEKVSEDKAKVINHIGLANKLIFNPSMKEEEANNIALELVKEFLSLCNLKDEQKARKPYRSILDEFNCLERNSSLPREDKSKEDQRMIDTRYSVIFKEMALLIEENGNNLFKT